MQSTTENKKTPSSKALKEYLNEHVKGNVKETTEQTEDVPI